MIKYKSYVVQHNSLQSEALKLYFLIKNNEVNKISIFAGICINVNFYDIKCNDLLTESTLTLEALTTLLSNVDWRVVGSWLQLPNSKLEMIRFPTESQCREACWKLFLKEHPCPSWRLVGWSLIYCGYHKELQEVQKHYQGVTYNIAYTLLHWHDPIFCGVIIDINVIIILSIATRFFLLLQLVKRVTIMFLRAFQAGRLEK